jgi:hypothetical protein
MGKPGLCRAVRSTDTASAIDEQTVLFKKKHSSLSKESREMYPMLTRVYHMKAIPAIKALK